MLSLKFRIGIVIPTTHRFALCAVALACVLNIAAAPISPDFDQRVLAAHNSARAQLGLPPLRWNPHLADIAASRASQLATSHIFEHTTENSMSPQGENIWGGTRGYYKPEDMVNAWAEERQYFKPGIFPDNSTTGNVEDVGHFTQIVWRNTTEVGCATTNDGEFDILVCRYSPAGNYLGEKPF
jgi:uncharacterized protein YkwD